MHGTLLTCTDAVLLRTSSTNGWLYGQQKWRKWSRKM